VHLVAVLHLAGEQAIVAAERDVLARFVGRKRAPSMAITRNSERLGESLCHSTMRPGLEARPCVSSKLDV